MHLKKEPTFVDLEDLEISEDEIAEILVIPLPITDEQEDNNDDAQGEWMIAGFEEDDDDNDDEEDQLLDVLGNLVTGQEDDDDTASDSGLSEAFDLLENAFMSPNLPDGAEASRAGSPTENGEMIDEEFGNKECRHCTCTHGYRGNIGPIGGGAMDAATQQYFDSFGPVDVTLFVAGVVEIPCHKSVICKCSDYFAAMFESQMMESHQEKVELKEVDGNLLELLIHFAYTHKLSLEISTIDAIMTSARMLQFHEVISRCSEFMKNNLNSSNCLETMALADTLAINGLHNLATMWALWEAESVTQHQDFLLISQEMLCKYLSNNKLNLSEFKVYEALVRWVEFNLEERQQELYSLIKIVRMGLFSEAELSSVEENQLIQGDPQCAKLMLDIRRCLRKGCVQSDLLPQSFCKQRDLPPHKLVVLGGQFETETETLPNFGMYEFTKDLGKFEYRRQTSPLNEQQLGELVGYRCCVLGKDLYMSGGEVRMGRNNWHNKLLRFDGFTNDWSEVCDIPHPRRHHSMVTWGKHLYLIGGFGRHRILLDTVDRYDTEKDDWETMPSLNTAVYSAGVCVCDEKLYVVKHNMECFTPKAPRWINIVVPLPFEMGIYNCVPKDKTIYLIGSYVRNLVAYDTESRALTTLGKFNAVSGPAALYGDVIYVVGGQDTRDVETYDLETKEFGVACEFPKLMTSHHCVALPAYPPARGPGCYTCAM